MLIWSLKCHIAYGRATDPCQIRKERVLSAGLSVRIQPDTFAAERALGIICGICVDAMCSSRGLRVVARVYLLK